MKRLHQRSTILALALLASVSYADGKCANESLPGANQSAPDSRRIPKDSCLHPCAVIRISTRCECSLGKTLPTATRT